MPFICLFCSQIHSFPHLSLPLSVFIGTYISQTLLLNSGLFQKWGALAEKQEGRRKGEARIFLPFPFSSTGHLFQLPSNNPSFRPASSCPTGLLQVQLPSEGPGSGIQPHCCLGPSDLGQVELPAPCCFWAPHHHTFDFPSSSITWVTCFLFKIPS